MKTLLVLSSHPDFVEAIRAGLDAEKYRVVHRLTVDDGEPLLVHSLIAACVIDADIMGVECVWIIERLRRRDTRTPIIAFVDMPQSDWEEEVFSRGVTHVLTKPVRPRLLNSILDRLWSQPAAGQTAAVAVPSGNTALFNRAATDPGAVSRFVNATQTLGVLRDFSSIMTHSLDEEAMLKKFLQFLRDMLSVNRAAIFLNRPSSPLGEALHPDDGRRLRAAAAIGLSSGLLQHFELSLDSGLGAEVNRLGRILRRDSEEARLNAQVQKEFDLLGAQVAVPIPDRESIVGLAVFDGRVTGEALVNVELEMIFHLLEQVGMALRNIWLHDQLAGNHEMMTDVLRELSSACMVFGRDLKVLHANKAARRHFGGKNQRSGGLEFSDLPQALGAKVYQVLKTGAALEPFRFEPETSQGVAYNVSVVPFQRGKVALPQSVLLTADDLSQSEQLSKLEMETANLRLVRTMADRLAHEIGNAMVPLSTHQQLLAEKFHDEEFLESLDQALAGGVKRVSRLLNQMRFLASEGCFHAEVFGVDQLVEEAYKEAAQQQPMEGAQLKLENFGAPIVISGDRAALRHALAEIMLNALQANPKNPQVGVRLRAEANGHGNGVTIEVQDNGGGFSADAARKAPAPFYTTRNVGLGLGLAVCQRILETHHGKLEIVPSPSGLVRVSLPAELPSAGGGSAAQ